MTSAGEYEAGASAVDPGGFEPPATSSSALRRWWLVAVCVALALAGGFVYLAMAQRIYAVSAILAMDMTGDAATSADAFLLKQREIIRTPEILGTDAARLRSDLRVIPSARDGTITLSLDTTEPAIAARKLGEITSRYLSQSVSSPPSSIEKLKELTAQRDRFAADRAAKAQALVEFKTKSNITGTTADKAAMTRLEQLRAALTSAQLEAAMAKADVDTADAVLADPAQRDAMIVKHRGTGAFATLDEKRGKIDAELETLAVQAQKHRETLGPQHPAIVQVQQKIEQTKRKLAELDEEYAKAYRVYVQQQQAAADKKMQEVAALVEAQSSGTQDYAAILKQLDQLEAELKAADASLAEADRKITEAATAVDPAVVALRVVQPPRAADRPTHPRPLRVMLIAGGIGIVLGAALALATARTR